MEELPVDNRRPDESLTQISGAELQDSKPSHMIKPLPDETAPRNAEYLGSFPVMEATPEERAAYVGKQLELITKRNTKALKPVCIAMTLSGVKICDPTMKEVYMSHALRRISYTTCVPSENLLSFVSRNPGESLSNQYCHSFKTEHASEINSIIGGAFLTAYTLRRKKKKRLSLVMTDDNLENSISADGDITSNESFEDVSPAQYVHAPIKKSSSASGAETPGELSSDKTNDAVKTSSPVENREELSELESRVFAALNEKAQSTTTAGNNVPRRRSKAGSMSQREPVLERLTNRSRLPRRPISYHEASSRLRNGNPNQQKHKLSSEVVPEGSTVDIDLEKLRVAEKPFGQKDHAPGQANWSRKNKSMSLGQGARNISPSKIKERDIQETQANCDTLRSNVGGGCAPTKAISDYFPFRFSKRKKEKKKYARSKTESVLVTDRTFDRLWNPRQRLNTCDDIAFRQRSDNISINSNACASRSPPASPISDDDVDANYCFRRTTSVELQGIGGCTPDQTCSVVIGSTNNKNAPISSIVRSQTPISETPSRLSPASETASTATTSSSSCPSSAYLTDATCEDSGMYTQSSNASTSSSDSSGRKSSRSSGSDSLMSGRSSIWYPQSTVNLNKTITSLEPTKTNAERLRQSLAGQMISADNFISLDAKMMSAAWYHPGIPIDVAMGILKGEDDGTFLLVRPIRKQAIYTLVVSCRGSCKLFNISKLDKVGYHIEGKNQFFPHVYILIAQYSCHPGPLPFKLKTMQMFNPLCREKINQ